ncbi:hypothetical protein F8M49_24285 [Rhodococcus zopfii]|uniref:Transmembrane protein n=1 Tax=Rhodococcus zopfii TaxID=43772 RepID=A0ABU3WUN4_9NOCA|nr:hypothetical protein [Rhodococcus zopfii]
MVNSTAAYLRTARRSSRRRNPLVRRTDRIEARLVAVLVVLVAAMIPVSVWAGAHTWDTQLEMSAQQTAERSLVTATTEDIPATPAATYGDYALAGPATVPASWTWGRETRHGNIEVDATTAAGSQVPVWVDADGRQTLPPMDATSAKVSSVLVGVSAWIGTMLVAGAVFTLTRWRLDLARARRWSRDIEIFLGSTNSY